MTEEHKDPTLRETFQKFTKPSLKGGLSFLAIGFILAGFFPQDFLLALGVLFGVTIGSGFYPLRVFAQGAGFVWGISGLISKKKVVKAPAGQ